MKKSRRNIFRVFDNGVILLGGALILAVWSVQAGERPEPLKFSITDERNRLPEAAGPEVYNAGAYRSMEREIEEALKEDPQLSASARAVEVTVADWKVILEGRVADEAERKAVLNVAKESAGLARIDDRMAEESVVR